MQLQQQSSQDASPYLRGNFSAWMLVELQMVLTSRSITVKKGKVVSVLN
jgi:hypothetical protein